MKLCTLRVVMGGLLFEASGNEAFVREHFADWLELYKQLPDEKPEDLPSMQVKH